MEEKHNTPNSSSFDEEKENLVVKLVNNIDDKSRAGKVDVQIKPLLDAINSRADFFTVSSCAGRFILVQNGPKSGYSVDWLFVSHDYVEDPKKMWNILSEQETSSSIPPIKKEEGFEIWFKLEPPIIAINARDVDTAQSFMDVVRSAGVKRPYITGVRGRVILGFGDTQRIETLVALNGKLLLNEDYLATITAMANKKLEKSRQKMERVRVAIEAKLSAMTKTLPSFENVEPKQDDNKKP